MLLSQPLKVGIEPFPGFRLRQLLGRGGLSEVWEAETASGAKVALKFAPCDQAVTAAKQLQAIQTIRPWRHPHLIGIDQVWSPPGYLVVAMELAERSLADLLAASQSKYGTPLEPKLVCKYLSQSAVALDFLNICQDNGKKALQHGDVKPSNMLLFGDIVKLADFGLSAPISSPVPSHRPAGSLDYAAPEVFQGQLSDQADQYALAISYCELRGGRIPYPKINALRPSWPKRRPRPDLSMLAPEEQLIIARALNREPQKRWPSCGDMMAQLSKVTQLTARISSIFSVGAAGHGSRTRKNADAPGPDPHSCECGYQKRGRRKSSRLESKPSKSDPDRLSKLLADQIESGAFAEARMTVGTLIGINPKDQAVQEARAFLDEQLKAVPTGVGSEFRRFLGHKNWVNSVAFAPCGTRAFSASGGILIDGEFKAGHDRTVRMWDLESGRQLHQLRAHTSVINSIAVAPDGHRILTGSRGGSIGLWDMENETLIRRFDSHAKLIWSVAISRDGHYALSGSDDGIVRLWEMNTGRRLCRFDGHSGGVASVAFSPDGRLALSGSFDKTVRLWDLKNGRELRRLDAHTQTVLSAVFSPDGRQVLTGGSDNTIRLWDVNGRELHRFTGHSYQVNGLAFAPNGRCFVSGSSDRTIRLWDTAKGRETYRFEGHADNVMSVDFSPDGRHVLSGGRDTTVRLWQVP
jgi:WD40 repeat protein